MATGSISMFPLMNEIACKHLSVNPRSTTTTSNLKTIVRGILTVAKKT